jgi:hypothetical protein
MSGYGVHRLLAVGLLWISILDVDSRDDQLILRHCVRLPDTPIRLANPRHPSAGDVVEDRLQLTIT